MQVITLKEPAVVLIFTPEKARQLQAALRVANEEYVEMVEMAKNAGIADHDVEKFQAWVDFTDDLWLDLQEALV